MGKRGGNPVLSVGGAVGRVMPAPTNRQNTLPPNSGFVDVSVLGCRHFAHPRPFWLGVVGTWVAFREDLGCPASGVKIGKILGLINKS